VQYVPNKRNDFSRVETKETTLEKSVPPTFYRPENEDCFLLPTKKPHCLCVERILFANVGVGVGVEEKCEEHPFGGLLRLEKIKRFVVVVIVVVVIMMTIEDKQCFNHRRCRCCCCCCCCCDDD